MTRPVWAPEDINLDMPSVARMYDYYLGGMHNFAIDRQMADMGVQLWPRLPMIMRANRAFLTRAVRFLLDAGVRQFLDVGSGIPTAGNVHEIVHAVHPDAPVVYADIDPVAVAHSRALLAGDPAAAAVQADFREPEALFADPAVRKLIDFDQPVALLLVALLHFVPDSDHPDAIIGRYRAALAPGSHLVLSHFSDEGSPEQVAGLLRLSQATPTPMTMRSRSRVAEFFTGFELVDPGLVYLPLWRPEHPEDVPPDPDSYNDFCAVGRKEQDPASRDR